MINIIPFFSKQRTIYFEHAVNLNMKKVIYILAHMVHQTDSNVSISYITRILAEREKLGSTYIGHGIAIPHGRILGLKQPTISLIASKNPILYSKKNSDQAQLFFGLLIPETSDKKNDPHVAILAALVEKLKNKSYRDHLKRATSNQMLYQAAIEEV